MLPMPIAEEIVPHIATSWHYKEAEEKRESSSENDSDEEDYSDEEVSDEGEMDHFIMRYTEALLHRFGERLRGEDDSDSDSEDYGGIYLDEDGSYYEDSDMERDDEDDDDDDDDNDDEDYEDEDEEEEGYPTPDRVEIPDFGMPDLVDEDENEDDEDEEEEEELEGAHVEKFMNWALNLRSSMMEMSDEMKFLTLLEKLRVPGESDESSESDASQVEGLPLAEIE
jgi:hypothetical protein